jgi:hypothetical protein
VDSHIGADGAALGVYTDVVAVDADAVQHALPSYYETQRFDVVAGGKLMRDRSCGRCRAGAGRKPEVLADDLACATKAHLSGT